MASISTDKAGNKTMQFTGLDGKRKTVRLGKARARTVDTIKTHVEEMLEAHGAGRTLYEETQAWLKKINAKSPTLYAKLANLGLAPKRKAPEQTTLGKFLDSYIVGRSDVKGGTSTVYGHTKRCLIDYFGASKPLVEITAGEADDWRRWLLRPVNDEDPTQGGQGLSDNTGRRRCGIAKQFFRDALRRRLIAENPFADMKGTSVLANRTRDYFVSRDEADKVIKACPDTQWELLFALSRYGGLRCPSEHLRLTWGDVDLDAGKMVVHSPKTAHHEGKEMRIVPIFPELRPYLEAVRNELLEDFDPKLKRLSEQPVITRYRDGNSNLRTQLLRIIKAAKLKPWPKLWQNLRSTRETELCEKFPMHVVCEWIGHSQAVASKHYLQTTDEHFELAASEPTGALQKALPKTADETRSEANQEDDASDSSLDCASLRYCTLVPVGDVGLEPTTFWV
jgi:integrase